jgi:uncharacterized protein
VACGPDVEHLSKGSDTLIKQLLQAGADPNARTAAPGHTALMLSRSSAVANCLLDNGADIELKTDDGCVALHVACANGRLAVVKTLLARGARCAVTTVAPHLFAQQCKVDTKR